MPDADAVIDEVFRLIKGVTGCAFAGHKVHIWNDPYSHITISLGLSTAHIRLDDDGRLIIRMLFDDPNNDRTIGIVPLSDPDFFDKVVGFARGCDV